MEKASVATGEELQHELLATQLEQAKIQLEQTRDQNADYRQRKQVAERTNANRQAQFRMDRSNLRALQHRCQHMAGGDAEGNPLEGGGKFAFSVIAKTIMPDGKTEVLQCPRCRLTLYGMERAPQEEVKMKAAAEAAEKRDPKKFMNDAAWLRWNDHLWWTELRALHRKEGVKKSVMRGPTFTFERDGVPVIPDITGYATSGAGGR